MSKKNTYLVTGCAGFIGAKTAEILLARGHKVIGVDGLLDNLYPNTYKQKRLKELKKYPLFSFHQLNLAEEDFSHLVKGADCVFHFAAMAGLEKSWTDPNIYFKNNVTATRKLIEAIRDNGKPHLVHASTSSVYGLIATQDENSALSPISPYGETKLQAEELIRNFSKDQGVTFTILRFFSVYGPGQRPDMAYSKFCNSLANQGKIIVNGDGTQTRSNTYIEDAAMAAVIASEVKPINETFNIAGIESISVLEAIDVLAERFNVTPNISFGPPARGDQKETRGNINKAQKELGWTPVFNLKQGLINQANEFILFREGTKEHG